MNGYAYYHRVDQVNGGDMNHTHTTGFSKKEGFWYVGILGACCSTVLGVSILGLQQVVDKVCCQLPCRHWPIQRCLK